MPGLTMTDCSVADNVTQARYEFERAMTTSGYAALSSWAVKWGRSLLDVAAEHAGYDTPDDGAEIDRLTNETKVLRAAMIKAIDVLESA